jgi:hypothetical protein
VQRIDIRAMHEFMTRWIFGILDRLLVVAGAVVFSQAPQFFSQYLHRLSGHAEEIKIHTQAIRQAARASGRELSEYMLKFSQHPDPDVSKHGEIMQGMLNRYAELTQAAGAMQESTLLSRPFVFMKTFQPEIVKSTLASFQPGIVLTWEGIAYALIGMLVGYSAFLIIQGVFRAVWSLLQSPSYLRRTVPVKKINR